MSKNTPICDEAQFIARDLELLTDHDVVPIDVARKLEIERDEWRKIADAHLVSVRHFEGRSLVLTEKVNAAIDAIQDIGECSCSHDVEACWKHSVIDAIKQAGEA